MNLKDNSIYLRSHRHTIAREVLLAEIMIDNTGEYLGHRFVAELVDTQHIEVTQESWRHRILAGPGRPHRRDHLNVYELNFRGVLFVVEDAVIENLSDMIVEIKKGLVK